MRRLARLNAPAVLARLPDFVAAASESARAGGLGPRKVGSVELAVEEAVTNICKYAGQDQPAEIALACFADDTLFAVEISDDGKPFDMTAQPDPDVTAGLEQRPLGGLGVFLIKKAADAVRYERRDGRNRLRLEFRLSSRA